MNLSISWWIRIKIIYSRHALEKTDGYGLDIEEVEKAIKQGMKWKEEDSDKLHARMAGIECVFIKEEDEIFVITVYKEADEKWDA